MRPPRRKRPPSEEDRHGENNTQHVWDHPAFTSLSRYDVEPYLKNSEEAAAYARTILERGPSPIKPWEIWLETCSQPVFDEQLLAWETICMTKYGYHVKVTVPLPADKGVNLMIASLKFLATQNKASGRRRAKRRRFPSKSIVPTTLEEMRKSVECLRKRFPEIYRFPKIRGLEHTVFCIED